MSSNSTSSASASGGIGFLGALTILFITLKVHEALKDGRQLVKDMKAVKADLEQTSREVFDEQMTATVKAGLEEYKQTLDVNIEKATDAVMERFETISNSLMYGNKQGRGENILETAAAKAAQERQS